MNRLLAIFMIFLLLFSCTEKEQPITPENVLKQEKMVAIMVDIHLLEGAFHLNLLPPDTTGENKIISRYGHIFSKHATTRKQYNESLKYYMQHPELLNKIYDNILTELSKKEAELTNK